MFTTTSRKVLVPFATLVAAGAVAIGSGATFSSETANSVSVTSGELAQYNSRDGLTLELDNIVPGDSMAGTVVIENTGTVDSTLDIVASGVTDNFTDGMLTITITANDGTTAETLWDSADGDFGDLVLADTGNSFNVDASITYIFTVTLDADATNADQEKTADATFTFTQAQLDGESLTESWVS